ncbi:hypothetical protein PILCRDRAFT_767142 [Piloderma croceum F 1598]|uniref:Uncharacterized protein n=1 Tax=Piloderma croceum (strain F 1598) TaxID=765440 RepID=A0A0C3BT62_PILCF|nr:hypothetical protein PILCRDRAFT_767142 [Piloderma croceum F 1598]
MDIPADLAASISLLLNTNAVPSVAEAQEIRSSLQRCNAEIVGVGADIDIGKTTRSPIDTKSPSDVELAVQVRVEQTVSVEYGSQDHESDHHRKPSEAWDFPSWPISFRLCSTWPIIYGQGRLLLTGECVGIILVAFAKVSAYRSIGGP